ncbi:MAG TPA: CDP-diacylglycerol--glycerol-3-phosphate 3-phosphatidyltransferase [Turneriella sp.]|nr:CDP-diacylglycerol--glycerol-3-phosphate 3-phosphatidyltransferase [Turneriella sp.]
MRLWLNLPNFLTIMRIVMIPFFIYYLASQHPLDRFIALSLFAFASVTDFFDGYLARKWKQESPLGRFLDPLADKALVIATLVIFILLDQAIPLWMVIVIILRDMLVTLMRYLAIRKGTEIRTTRLGKAKTMFQMFAMVLIIFILVLRVLPFDISATYAEGQAHGKKNIEIASAMLVKAVHSFQSDEIPKQMRNKYFAESTPYFLLLLTTLITAISGLRYLYTNWRVLLPPYTAILRKSNK